MSRYIAMGVGFSSAELRVVGLCRPNGPLPPLELLDSASSMDGTAEASKLCMCMVFATPLVDAMVEKRGIPQLQNFGVTSRIKHGVAKLPLLKFRTKPFENVFAISMFNRIGNEHV
jgi:hypothetical protein